mmetsp:Transcript_9697/g.27341  ORF Transcript_9697/g.27341 Transcript_9697/m.27341 type:complete len:318 (+) Transcript_9697:785-1738(+)
MARIPKVVIRDAFLGNVQLYLWSIQCPALLRRRQLVCECNSRLLVNDHASLSAGDLQEGSCLQEASGSGRHRVDGLEVESAYFVGLPEFPVRLLSATIQESPKNTGSRAGGSALCRREGRGSAEFLEPRPPHVREAKSTGQPGAPSGPADGFARPGPGLSGLCGSGAVSLDLLAWVQTAGRAGCRRCWWSGRRPGSEERAGELDLRRPHPVQPAVRRGRRDRGRGGQGPRNRGPHRHPSDASKFFGRRARPCAELAPPRWHRRQPHHQELPPPSRDHARPGPGYGCLAIVGAAIAGPAGRARGGAPAEPACQAPEEV